MTPAEALAIAATIGKRLKDPTELEAFRMVWRAYNNPLEAQMEAVRKLRPGASVAVQCVEPDPEFGQWRAWIIWYDPKPHEFAKMGETASDALKKLREALERVPTPKTPNDIRYEAEERAEIQGERK
jgi:hypothetical protein